MRRTFYELLANIDFDPQEEYGKLWRLFFCEKKINFRYNYYTLAEFIDDYYFRCLSFRGSCTSLSEMLQAIELFEDSDGSIDTLFVFCEFLYAVLFDTQAKNYEHSIKTTRATICDNVQHILACTNHELSKDREGRTIVVEKNKATTLAAELVDDDIIAYDLIEYNHFVLKGDLDTKKKLLCSIATHIEPILNERKLSLNGFKQLESDAGFLLNSFHIRHNNKTGAKEQEYIASIADAELEEWYDRAYEVALSVIIINNYISLSKKITDIKARYTWR